MKSGYCIAIPKGTELSAQTLHFPFAIAHADLKVGFSH